MVEILNKAYAIKHTEGGRKPKLTIENQLMMTLEYYREYRSMFHMGVEYGLSKSNVSETISWVEETLIKDGAFFLPSKKKLLTDELEIEVALVDVTECEIERPKKDKKTGTQEKRKNIQ